MRCNKTQRGTSLVTVRVPLSRETTRHMTVGREPKRLCSVEDDFRIMRLLSSSSIRGTVQQADFTSREIKVPVRASFHRCQATGGKTSSPFIENTPCGNGYACA